jgi:hypothetical protein
MKIDVKNNRDLVGEISSIHKARKNAEPFFEMVSETRESDRSLAEHVSKIRKSVDKIMQTLKVNQNLHLKDVDRNGTKYQIFINKNGMRMKHHYYTNTDAMRSSEFGKYFNAELLQLVHDSVKEYQQERLKDLMSLKSEFEDVLKLSTTRESFETMPFELDHYDGYHFQTKTVEKIDLPDVSFGGRNASEYDLIQLQTLVTPMIVDYNARHSIKEQTLVDLNKKIQAAYPLLFLFGDD